MRNTGCWKGRTRVRLLKFQGCRRLWKCTETDQKAIGWESVNWPESLTRKKNLVLSQKCTDHKNLALQLKGGRETHPQSRGGALVSRCQQRTLIKDFWSTPSCTWSSRHPQTSQAISSQRNPKKVEVRSLRVTTRGAVIVTWTSALLFRFLQTSASILFSKFVPGNSTYECCLPFVSLQTYPSVFTSHICQ